MNDKMSISQTAYNLEDNETNEPFVNSRNRWLPYLDDLWISLNIHTYPWCCTCTPFNSTSSMSISLDFICQFCRTTVIVDMWRRHSNCPTLHRMDHRTQLRSMFETECFRLLWYSPESVINLSHAAWIK